MEGEILNEYDIEGNTGNSDNSIDISEVTEESVGTATERPIMTTQFSDYSVTEGLLLVIVLLAFLVALKNCFKGVF